MNVVSLPASAKDVALAVAKWCEAAGVPYDFGTSKKHCYAQLTWNRQSRKVYFASTPSDRRARYNVLSDVRRTVRDLGWTGKSPPIEERLLPTPKEEKEMVHIVGGSAPSKPVQKSSEGPASVVTITRAGAEEAPPVPHHNEEINRRRIKARNKWVYEQSEAGRDPMKLLEQLRSVGWQIKGPDNIYAMKAQHKKDAGLSKPTAPKVRTPDPVVSHEADGRPDDLVMQLARAIAPIIEARLSECAEWKAKADKWDAISGLVRDE